jgi:hypothetical protein
MVGDDHAEARGVLESPSHDRGILDAVAVVGENLHAQRGHLCHRRQQPAFSADRYRASGPHVAASALGQVEYVAHDRGRVRRRLGIRHGDDRGVAAERRRPSPGLDRLGFFGPGLPQMGVQVNQARGDDAAARVEHDGAWPATAQPWLDLCHDLTFH